MEHSNTNVSEAMTVPELLKPHLPLFGYACDVGANDGVFKSNTLAFEQAGWLVLCIEPNPLLIEAGLKHRKLWRQVAAGAWDISVVQFTALGVYPYASWSSTEPKNKYPPKIMPDLLWKAVNAVGRNFIVPMLTLNTILEQSGFPRLDLLTIDVEGHELDVLAGINLEVWKPKVIVAEAWEDEAKQRLSEHLAKHHYVLDATVELDCCFGRRN